MMKYLISLLTVFFVIALYAREWDFASKDISYAVIDYNGGEILFVKVDPASFSIELSYDQKRIYIDEIREDEIVFAINAGFFFTENEKKGIPVGMLKISEEYFGAINRRYPFFYKRKGIPGITDSYSWITNNLDSIDMLFQAGPVLVWNDKTYDNFSNRLHERSAIGITKDNMIIFCLSKNVYLSLSELAMVLKEFHCYRAINLDGSGSSQGFLSHEGYEWESGGYYRVPIYITVRQLDN